MFSVTDAKAAPDLWTNEALPWCCIYLWGGAFSPCQDSLSALLALKVTLEASYPPGKPFPIMMAQTELS